MPIRVAIYGSRPDGHAKVVIDALRDLQGWECAGLIDDFPINHGREIEGHRVLGGFEVIAELPRRGISGVLLGFGDGARRRQMIDELAASQLACPVLVHPAAVCSATASLGDGCQVMAGARIAADACLGPGVLVNTGAIVEHDVTLEGGVSLGPGAVLAGRIVVRRDASIGAGVTVVPDIEIGAGSIVGAGAVVVRNVEPGAIVAGNPAGPL